jgi:hypothetical protein
MRAGRGVQSAAMTGPHAVDPPATRQACSRKGLAYRSRPSFAKLCRIRRCLRRRLRPETVRSANMTAFRPFAMERWQSTWEHRVRFNLSESGVHPLSTRELLEICRQLPEVGHEQVDGQRQREEAEDHVLDPEQVLQRRGRGVDPARERQDQDQGVERRMARPRGPDLPARRAGRHRRHPAVAQAPGQPQQGEHEDHEAPALVGLGEVELPDQVLDEVRHVDPEPELEQDQPGHGPVHQAGDPAPAPLVVAGAHRASGSARR